MKRYSLLLLSSLLLYVSCVKEEVSCELVGDELSYDKPVCEISFDEQGRETGRVNYTYADNGLLIETCSTVPQDSSYFIKSEYVYEGNRVKCYRSKGGKDGRRLFSERIYRDGDYRMLECEVEYIDYDFKRITNFYYDDNGRLLRCVKHMGHGISETYVSEIFIYDYKRITIFTSNVLVEDVGDSFPIISITVDDYRDEDYKYIARHSSYDKASMGEGFIHVRTIEYGYDGCGRVAYTGLSEYFLGYDVAKETHEWQYVYSGKNIYGSYVYHNYDPVDPYVPNTIRSSYLRICM